MAIPVSCYCRASGPPVCPRNGRSRRGFRSTGRSDGRRNQSAGCSWVPYRPWASWTREWVCVCVCVSHWEGESVRSEERIIKWDLWSWILSLRGGWSVRGPSVRAMTVGGRREDEERRERREDLLLFPCLAWWNAVGGGPLHISLPRGWTYTENEYGETLPYIKIYQYTEIRKLVRKLPPVNYPGN